MNEQEYYADLLRRNRRDNFGPFSGFKIVFHMASPICVSWPWLSLDSILDHLMFSESLGREIFTTPKKINLSDCEVVGKRPYGKIWHPGAKIAIPTISYGEFDREIIYRTETIYKRFEERFAKFSGKIYIGMGPFRSYMMKHIVIPAKTVAFRVWGDLKYIRGLIERNLFALGNDIRIGYGRIRKVEFMPTNYKGSDCVWENERALRAIPVEFCRDQHDIVPMPYRSPYWDPRNVRPCVVPFTKCEIRDEFQAAA